MQHKLYRMPTGEKISLPEDAPAPEGARYLYRAEFGHDEAMARLEQMARDGVQERREELKRTAGGHVELRAIDNEIEGLLRCLT